MSSTASGVAACRLLDLTTVSDERGSLTVAEFEDDIPFTVRRVFFLHSVPPGMRRAFHAHREQHQVILAVSGRFDVMLDDGRSSRTVALSDPRRGLYVPPMVWKELGGFSPEAVCAVLTSIPYREDDYYRDYDAFRRALDGPT